MQTADEQRERALQADHLRWWHEVLFVLTFYSFYSAVRNVFGSSKVSPQHAFNNAKAVIRVEKALGLYHEQRIQSWFIDWHWFIRFWDIYYGSFHFFVTAAALITVYRKLPQMYSVARATLASATGLAIIGFATFPLMPPRLLDSTTEYGGALLHPGKYGFQDTLAKVGGLWSFDSGTVAAISNQYAAMPSLHIGWSTWVLFVLWPLAKRGWQKALLITYPLATLFCIIVTANHFWIDGAGGLLTLGCGYLVGRTAHRWYQGWRRAKMVAPATS